ncbi:hypothetical protein FACS189419_04600 [Planctomycetales bacterium]|nr:hypothetical protein FACS189419_04600 [Planctomycetales bacterium]
MFRFLFLLCSLFILPLCCCEEIVTAKPETPANENDVLLDKAFDALHWFDTLGSTVNKKGEPPKKYREKISPLELFRVVLILKQFDKPEKTEIAEKLLAMIPYFEIPPEDAFGLLDEWDKKSWDTIAGLNKDVVEKINRDAVYFRKNMLTSIEKVALFKEPGNAEELFKVLDVITVTGRNVLTRHYLKKFSEDKNFNVTPEVAAEIIDTTGSDSLFRIAADKKLAPFGKEAVEKLIAEAQKHWQNTGIVSEAAKKLTSQLSDAPQEHLDALAVLWKGGRVSLKELIGELEKTHNVKEADEITAVILSMRRDSKEILAAVLGSRNEDTRYYAARGLAASIKPDEVFLLYPYIYADNTGQKEVRKLLQQRHIDLPAKAEAIKELYLRAEDYLEHRRTLPFDADRKVSFWHWSSEENTPEAVNELIPLEQAFNQYARDYAVKCTELDEHQSERIRQLVYTASAEAGIIQTDVPQENTEFWEKLFAENIAKEHFKAAVFGIESLAKSGDKSLVESRDGKVRPLVQATVAKDSRVRFAALKAVMELKPETPYAGSSFISETLIWFSKSNGERLIVTAHPKLSAAKNIAGYFMEAGYKDEAATTCRDAFQLACESPDVELVVIDAITRQPPLGDFLAAMTADCRTAEIPIAVLSSDKEKLKPENNQQYRRTQEHFDKRHPDNPYVNGLALTYPWITSKESADWILKDLLAKTGSTPVPAEERLKQARQALVWLKDIIEDSQKGYKIYQFDDIDTVVFKAIESNVRLAEGLDLAASVKNPRLQKILYEIAANAVHPMAVRNTAAASFERSIKLHGILLRGQEIQHIYDRYNVSEHEPKESQQLLSKIIDAVEANYKK